MVLLTVIVICLVPSLIQILVTCNLYGQKPEWLLKPNSVGLTAIDTMLKSHTHDSRLTDHRSPVSFRAAGTVMRFPFW